MRRRIGAEFLGSLLLAAAVIGSGIMAERLAGGNAAIALLANTAATVAALAVLIAMFSPVSGAHFNPAVTLVTVLARAQNGGAAFYVLAQLAGCVAGALLAHAMFELPLLQLSTQVRTGWAQALAEFVATAGLILVIESCANARAAAWRVPAWIGAAYWFTASTSFANPAITVARSLSNTFAGIRPLDVPLFIAAQLLGALAGWLIARELYGSRLSQSESESS